MFDRNQLTYIFVFIKYRYETPTIIGKKKYKSLKKFAVLKNKQIPVSMDKPTYIYGKKVYYVFNVDNGSQLSFSQMNSSVGPEELDIIMTQEIIRQLAHGIMDNFKEKLYTLIMGVVMGALITAVILVMYYTNKIEELYAELIDNSSVITNPIVPIVSRLLQFKFKRW